jgi:hypothetical protein
MKYLVVAIALALALQGCIPLMIGGYIGYQMSQHDEHAQWCVQNASDGSCHP